MDNKIRKFNYKKAKEKWFNDNVIEFDARLYVGYDNLSIVEYSKIQQSLYFPHQTDSNVVATQYKLSKLKPYEIYFVLRNVARKNNDVHFYDIKVKHSLV